jgi:carbon starvation protein CstA
MNDELGFGSKIDLWLLIAALTAVAVCGAALAHNWNSLLAQDVWFTALVVILLGIGIVIPLWILLSLRYFLSATRLRVRCGPFSWRIAIGEITGVVPTRSALSSPAGSLDRVRIEYGNGQALMISPEPRAEFLRQLEHRRKELEHRGDESDA